MKLTIEVKTKRAKQLGEELKCLRKKEKHYTFLHRG